MNFTVKILTVVSQDFSKRPPLFLLQPKSRSSRARCAATSRAGCTTASSRARAARASSAAARAPWSTTSARARRTAWWTGSTGTGASSAGCRSASRSACPETVRKKQRSSYTINLACLLVLGKNTCTPHKSGSRGYKSMGREKPSSSRRRSSYSYSFFRYNTTTFSSSGRCVARRSETFPLTADFFQFPPPRSMGAANKAKKRRFLRGKTTKMMTTEMEKMGDALDCGGGWEGMERMLGEGNGVWGEIRI